MADSFHPGQRWISETEPELGLGLIALINPRSVVVSFDAASERREYALDNAPLRRVQFHVGDAITNHKSEQMTVESVTVRNGLNVYHGRSGAWAESDLNSAISFNQPQERLLAGQFDEPRLFDLRYEALRRQHQRRQSQVRGFIGGRIDLIPHQLYIAAEVAARLAPRVLLADEVGLGKTIEACLILHRLILTGRAQRVLILVPDSLVHQWFVELLRRFNLWFHIFDEERCAAIDGGNAEINPFLDDQLVIAPLSLLAKNVLRIAQALAADWDLLVVDEAHHLGWSPDSPNKEYQVVESLGRRIPGLLLLTATPEQLGLESHFARLRLLDPDRFNDLNAFIDESNHYQAIARLADKLLLNAALSPTESQSLAAILGQPQSQVASTLERITNGDTIARSGLINSLLDLHGTGRVMFRNTRATISGFPKRQANLVSLSAPKSDERFFDKLAEEFAADLHSQTSTGFTPDYSSDPRILWLTEFLNTQSSQKVLLICRTQAKVSAIAAALRTKLNIKQAVFHEGLTLVQRDRNAAWFSEEDGARILICSEIGGEGRNFQFAHHLVMFDLPPDPELLEQRIGRLDRIGQTSEIQIHIPYVPSSSPEVLVRWFNEGLDAFEKNSPGNRELWQRYGAQVRDLALDFHETSATTRNDLDRLIVETQAARKELSARLEQGRDRLLELNSFRPELTKQLIREITQAGDDTALDSFMLALFDHFNIQLEELSSRTFQLGSSGVFADSFPGLPADGMTVTANRPRALAREDIQFLTWDHPLVTGGLDLLLGSQAGNSSFALWNDPKTAGLYLETVFVLECIAPAHLHADRFLPPVPFRALVDQRGADVSSGISSELLARNLKPSRHCLWLDGSEFREELLPRLLQKSEATVAKKTSETIASAREAMNLQLGREILRLRELQQINRSVRPDEITRLVEQQQLLDQHLATARLRLDALRLIQRGPLGN